jgi:hypothetical protein
VAGKECSAGDTSKAGKERQQGEIKGLHQHIRLDKGSPAPGLVASTSKQIDVVKKVKYVEVSDGEDSAREPQKLELVQGGVGKKRKNDRQKGPLQVEQTKSESKGHVASWFKSKWPLRKAALAVQHKGIIPPASTALRHKLLTCDLCQSCNLHCQSEITNLSDEEASKFEPVVCVTQPGGRACTNCRSWKEKCFCHPSSWGRSHQVMDKEVEGLWD